MYNKPDVFTKSSNKNDKEKKQSNAIKLTFRVPSANESTFQPRNCLLPVNLEERWEGICNQTPVMPKTPIIKKELNSNEAVQPIDSTTTTGSLVKMELQDPLDLSEQQNTNQAAFGELWYLQQNTCIF